MKARGLRGAAGVCAVTAIVYLLARGVAPALFGALDPALTGLLTAAFSLAAALIFCVEATHLHWGDLRLAEPAPWSPQFCFLVFLGAAGAANLFGGVLGILAGRGGNEAVLLGGGGTLLARFVALCVVPAIGEELLFRGAMQSLLRPSGSAAAIFGPAVLFALLHLDFVQGLTALVCGVFLGWLVERTGSVLPGMALHFANNFLAFLAVWLRQNVSVGAATALELALLLALPVAAAWALWQALGQGFRFSAGLRGGAEAWEVLKSPAYAVCLVFLVVYTIFLTGGAA